MAANDPFVQKNIVYLSLLMKRVNMQEKLLVESNKSRQSLYKRLENLESRLAALSQRLETPGQPLPSSPFASPAILSASPVSPAPPSDGDTPSAVQVLAQEYTALRTETQLRAEVTMLTHAQPGGATPDTLQTTFIPTASPDYEQLLSQLLQTIFTNDSAIHQAAQNLVNAFITEHIPPLEQCTPLRDLVQRFKPLADLLLAQLARFSPDIVQPLQNAYKRMNSLQGEIQEFEQMLLDQQLTLSIPSFHIPCTLAAGISHSIFARVAWALRNLTKKLYDPLGYFTELYDRMLTSEGIMLIDFCDTTTEAAPLRGPLMEFLTNLGLQDTSPTVGTLFNPHHHDVICIRDGAPRDQIVEVSRRGWYYKGQEIRKASVVIGK